MANRERLSATCDPVLQFFQRDPCIRIRAKIRHSLIEDSVFFVRQIIVVDRYGTTHQFLSLGE